MSDPDGGPSLDDLRHRPLLFVDDLEAPTLAEADLHHFRRVLRVAPGSEIVLGDGGGRWRLALFGPEPEVTGPIQTVAPTEHLLTVAFAPVKGAKAEWVVQKLTELGIDYICPVLTERTVVRWDDGKRQRLIERMVGAAREACLQARRLRIPTVEAPTTLDQFLADRPEAVLADPGGTSGAGARTIVVGPEGGFSSDELAGRQTARLPGHVLRAETAAIAASVTVVAVRDGLFRPVSDDLDRFG